MTTTGPKVAEDGGTDSEPAAELLRVSKSFPGVQALREVSLVIPQNRVVGLVGENGAGKSTLLSTLNGTVRPDAGVIKVAGRRVDLDNPQAALRHGIGTVFQEQGLVVTLAVFENLFLGRERLLAKAGHWSRASRLRLGQQVLDKLGIDVSARAYTGDLPFAERQRVAIAKAFAITELHAVHPIILLDEPTSALSDTEISALFDSIGRWRRTASFVFVSHRLSESIDVCDSIVVLRDGAVVDHRPSDALTESEVHRLVCGRERTETYYSEPQQREPGDRTVLELDGLSVPGALSNVCLRVREGEILGISGVLGSGKSELARSVAGVQGGWTGDIAVFGRRVRTGVSGAIAAGVGYIPAERSVEGVIPTQTVQFNAALAGLRRFRVSKTPWLDARAIRRHSEHWISALGIKCRGPDTTVGQLSGGNAQKVVFAKWLAERPKVLVLEQPSRGLDVGAKEDLYRLLRVLARDGLAMVLISDDLRELIGLSNRIAVLRDGHLQRVVEAPIDAKPSETDVVRWML